MGKLLSLLQYVFFVFSSDINEGRRHVHVKGKKGNNECMCKFWIEPQVELEYNYGFKEKELNQIRKAIESNLFILDRQLDQFYAGKKVKNILKNE